MGYKGYPLNLSSDTFNAFKTDFNSMLKHTIHTMQQKEGETAQISIAFKITLTKGEAPDTEISAYEADREIVIPKIEHKMKSLIRIQEERAGVVGGAKYELIWDKDLCEYIMHEIKDGNPTLFDYLPDEEAEQAAEALPFGEDVPPECDEYFAGCRILEDCGICCRDCKEPKNCLQICNKYMDRAGELTADAVPEIVDLANLPASVTEGDDE